MSLVFKLVSVENLCEPYAYLFSFDYFGRLLMMVCHDFPPASPSSNYFDFCSNTSELAYGLLNAKTEVASMI